MDKNSLSHTTWRCQYHIIQTLCRYKGVEIIKGAMCLDHVPLCVSISPKMSVLTFMGYLKGKVP